MTNMLTIASGVLIGGSVLGMLGFGLVVMAREFQKPRADRMKTPQGQLGGLSFLIGLWAALMVILYGLP